MTRKSVLVSCLAALLFAASTVLWAGEVGASRQDEPEHPGMSGSTTPSKTSTAPKEEPPKETPGKTETQKETPARPEITRPAEIGPSVIRIYEPPVYYPYVPYEYRYSYPYPYRYAPPPLPRQTPQIYEWDRDKDAILRWDEYTQRFKWEATVPPKQYDTKVLVRGGSSDGASESKETRVARQVAALTGEVVSVRISEGASRITIRVNDKEATYSVADDALIVRGAERGRGEEITLGEVRAGDRVKLGFGSDGSVNSVRAVYKVLTGIVMAVAKGTALLDSGDTFKMTEDTQVLLPGKIKGKVSDVETGDNVRVEVGPVSDQAYLVQLRSPGDLETLVETKEKPTPTDQ